MRFYADLHVHSRFSRATSKDCNLPQLSYWAGTKGIALVATGDFTHPEWREEIREALVPAEPGLFRLKPELERETAQRFESETGGHSPPSAVGPTRFILNVEISTIYKKGDRTRKVHHVVFVPDFDTADRVVDSLSRIGNLNSDGRPILGLDSRDLLEITLESGDGAYLIPAHIWTPWFSALGSKSGFDTIEECYGDLTSHIFAVETGLSSDPPMNWRLSSLDRFALVSNSDAHSPAKLGREACVFESDLDYFAVRKSLETRRGYEGTVELFPEEGKYHMDGHRKCDARLTPEKTREAGGLCPVCGKKVTVGVMSRVVELADKPEGRRPRGSAGFRSFVPLAEVVGEILGVGPSSKRVAQAYRTLTSRLGPELFILEQAEPEDIGRVGSPLLAEAVTRMRQGRVIREAGYDGEYGIIRLFEREELRKDTGTGMLFDTPADPPRPAGTPPRRGSSHGGRSEATQPAAVREERETFAEPELLGVLDSLDEAQKSAAQILEGPLLIIAGPGTGKTRTLTHRIAHLVLSRGVAPEQCLAITFTRRAAGEMGERLRHLLPDHASRVPVMTFHALGDMILREHGDRVGLPSSFRVASDEERAEVLTTSLSISRRKAGGLLGRISRVKRQGAEAGDPATDAVLTGALHAYKSGMHSRGLVDFDDLVGLSVRVLSDNGEVAGQYRKRFRWVSVDEFQDIDEQQYRLIRLLVPPEGNLCAIGDPDQAIYGFRGTDVRLFQFFVCDYPEARVVQLTKNYRSGSSIVSAALQVIAPTTLVADRQLDALLQDPTKITIHESATHKAEAEFVVHTIERLVGGSAFFSMDSGRVESEEEGGFSFADFAVLYRTDAQADELCEAISRSGMPFQKRSHLRLADVPCIRSLTQAMGELPSTPPVVELLNDALGRLPDEEQANARALIPALLPVAERAGSPDSFMSELAMGVDVDLWDPRADSVSLLTLHAAKGLEFQVVFIVGCEDGLLPLHWGAPEEADIEEERRLFFVGMTRARRRLLLCRAAKRLRMGKVREMKASPFVAEIEEALIERSRSEVRGRRKAGYEQMALL
ncbi:UvrD-helicase domain-containing protein [Verrucomicrobiota bacterium]